MSESQSLRIRPHTSQLIPVTLFVVLHVVMPLISRKADWEPIIIHNLHEQSHNAIAAEHIQTSPVRYDPHQTRP